MDKDTVLSRLRSLRLTINTLAEDIRSGAYKAPFKGQGIEFDEVRHYEYGDDAKYIDRNVSARFGEPYLKLYREERETTIFLLTDASLSMDTGIGEISRREQASLVSALILLAGNAAGAQLGAAVFGAATERFFQPKTGRAQAMSIIGYLLDHRTKGPGSGLGSALIGACRRLKRHSLIIIVSDFLCLDWDQGLAEFAGRHDFAAFRITDPLEAEIPAAGLARLRDPETGLVCHAPTASSAFRSDWLHYNQDRRREWRESCSRYRIGHIDISSADDAAARLTRFFNPRRAL